MLPCAVIITIAGRSPSGVDAAMLADDVEPGAIGHQEVDHQQIERAFARGSGLRVAGVRRRHHLVAVVAQRAPERLEDLLFVVGEEDAANHGHTGLL